MSRDKDLKMNGGCPGWDKRTAPAVNLGPAYFSYAAPGACTPRPWNFLQPLQPAPRVLIQQQTTTQEDKRRSSPLSFTSSALWITNT